MRKTCRSLSLCLLPSPNMFSIWSPWPNLQSHGKIPSSTVSQSKLVSRLHPPELPTAQQVTQPWHCRLLCRCAIEIHLFNTFCSHLIPCPLLYSSNCHIYSNLIGLSFIHLIQAQTHPQKLSITKYRDELTATCISCNRACWLEMSYIALSFWLWYS